MLIYLYLPVRPSVCPCGHVSNIRDSAHCPGVVYVRPWYENASLEPYVCPFICCCQGRNFRNSPAREINEIIKYDNLRLYVRLLYHFHVDSCPKVQFLCPAMSVQTSHIGQLLLICIYQNRQKKTPKLSKFTYQICPNATGELLSIFDIHGGSIWKEKN